MRQKILVCAVLGLTGCGWIKEFTPIKPEAVRVRMPNQQRLLSLSVAQSITAACGPGGINLSLYRGKYARVEVNGVFPHSEADLLEYIAAGVEGELAKAGVQVVPRPLPQVVRTESPTDRVSIAVQPLAVSEPAHKVDLRVVVSVDWGGIDYKDQKYTKTGLLAGQLILGLAGVTLGSMTLGLGLGLDGKGGGAITGLTLGPILLAVGLGGSTIWGLAKSPFQHRFTLMSRTRITVRAIPLLEEVPPGDGSGEGAANIVIDTGSKDGYTHDFWHFEKR